MSLFSKIFRRSKPIPQPPTPASPPTATPPNPPHLSNSREPLDPIVLLQKLGSADGPAEPTAARLLAAALASPRQRDALEAISRAMTRGPVAEALRVSCARALQERGERSRALSFLEVVSHPGNLMMKADLLHDEGQVARAISVIERVLARDIDTPGARERHTRWRGTLSPRTNRKGPLDDVTMAVPSVQQSPYRILREVARGGAGTVYEARDDVIGRTLALKMYHRAKSDQEQIRRESQVAVQIAGPGIIRILDVDFEAGWIALEWLSRGSVKEVLSEGNATGLGEPLTFLRGLAHALGRVHRMGWVHADVKPANVLLDKVGAPVLSDFGIAVRPGDESLGGSAGYLSPERLGGAALHPSDDLYAVGRIIEDSASTGDPAWQAFLPLAERCMAVRNQRPTDGNTLSSLLESSA